MKRIAILLLAGALTGGFIAAQVPKAPAGGPGGPGRDWLSAPAVTVEGKLVFLNGFICITTPAKTWIVHLPAYIYGFVDGLKEGAQVKLEGKELALPVPQPTSNLMVTKLIFNGKEYDLSRSEHMGGFMRGFMGGFMGDGPWQGRGSERHPGPGMMQDKDRTDK